MNLYAYVRNKSIIAIDILGDKYRPWHEKMLRGAVLSFGLYLGCGKKGMTLGVDIPLGPDSSGAFKLGFGVGIGAGVSAGIGLPLFSLNDPGDEGIKFSACGGNRFGGGIDVDITPGGVGSQLTLGAGLGAGATITTFGNLR